MNHVVYFIGKTLHRVCLNEIYQSNEHDGAIDEKRAISTCIILMFLLKSCVSNIDNANI